MLANHLKSYAVLTIDVSTHMTAVWYPQGHVKLYISLVSVRKLLSVNPMFVKHKTKMSISKQFSNKFG